jgi:hypothetical protein
MPVLTTLYLIISYFQQVIAWICRYTAASRKRLLARRQVVRRCHIERGETMFATSVTPSRAKENFGAGTWHGQGVVRKQGSASRNSRARQPVRNIVNDQFRK